MDPLQSFRASLFVMPGKPKCYKLAQDTKFEEIEGGKRSELFVFDKAFFPLHQEVEINGDND